ncbi:hypothetical protein LCGC14_0478990 [marine sediment metagenome]|uniref:THIF-type NAD/FAD binding fold domain-containing protein n=1 Tax=marine sediment metagenome TaxID=412755 RepID=A0A0F9SF66_9ZZZZ
MYSRTRMRIENHLAKKGFNHEFEPDEDGYHIFRGKLPVKFGSMHISIKIKDWTLGEYPCIQIPDDHPLRQKSMPHINYDGTVCYAEKGTVVLNVTYPEKAIEYCLQQASHVLSILRFRPQQYLDDLKRDFWVYWSHQKQHIFRVQTLGFDWRQDCCYVIGDSKQPLDLWITSDSDTCISQLQTMHPDHGYVRLFTFPIIHYPQSLPSGFRKLPDTLQELLSWLALESQQAHRKLTNILASRFYTDYNHFGCLICTPDQQLGFIELTELVEQGVLNLATLGITEPSQAKGWITRFSVEDQSPKTVHGRNQQPMLDNKRILQIGAGAIGGYLTDILVRLGAGTGLGALTIVDPEVLEAGNTSRHRLGMEAVGQSKAEALVHRMKKEFPWANLISKNERMCDEVDFDYDLIIDATGDEPTTRFLNGEHVLNGVSQKGAMPSVLYAWIAGEGEAWETLLVENDRKLACRECLYFHEDSGNRKLRFPVTKKDPRPLHVGCQVTMPYAVTVAMSAAALAGEVVVDWLYGKVQPHYRVRTRTGADVYDIQDVDIPSQRDCPVCQKT